MFGTQNYFEVAKTNEIAFRAILRDLKANRPQRNMGRIVPQDLNTEAPLEEIFEKYSRGNRQYKFTISNFTVDGDKATISIQDVAPLSGGGATLCYSIQDSEVKYIGSPMVFMC